jgi:hypothetical protein
MYVFVIHVCVCIYTDTTMNHCSAAWLDACRQTDKLDLTKSNHAQNLAGKTSLHGAISILIAQSAWKTDAVTRGAYDALYKYAESLSPQELKLPRNDEQALREFFAATEREMNAEQDAIKRNEFFQRYYASVGPRVLHEVRDNCVYAYREFITDQTERKDSTQLVTVTDSAAYASYKIKANT